VDWHGAALGHRSQDAVAGAPRRVWRDTILPIAFGLAAGLFCGVAPITEGGSDARGTLLTAQALVDHGTLSLDAYPDAPGARRRVGRRVFYAFPPGTSLTAVPAVALARAAGLDMTKVPADEAMQNVLSSVAVAGIAMLSWLLARSVLPLWAAAGVATFFVFGTPVTSTMGAALWNLDFAVLATLAALLLVLRAERRARAPWQMAFAGLLVAWGFWCRPQAVLAGVAIGAWLFGRAVTSPPEARAERVRRLAMMGVGLACGIGLLVLTSLAAYGLWLPTYYRSTRVGATDTFWTAMYGHLISPSRGLLVFAPLAAVSLGTLALAPRQGVRMPLVTPSLLWMALHLAVASTFPHWWGGWSYGSRLMSDVLPAVLVAACAAAGVLMQRRGIVRAVGFSAFVVAGAAGVWINSVQGLWNPATRVWNRAPNVDRFPGYVFDWTFPQFLATSASLDRRLQLHREWVLPQIPVNRLLGPDHAALEFDGWAPPQRDEQGWSRRATEARPTLRFLVSVRRVTGRLDVTLAIEAAAGPPLSGMLWLNGEPLAPLHLGAEAVTVRGVVPRRRIRVLEYDVRQSNILEWRADDRRGGASGVVFRSLGFYVGGESQCE
jgi:hypothetical protein